MGGQYDQPVKGGKHLEILLEDERHLAKEKGVRVNFRGFSRRSRPAPGPPILSRPTPCKEFVLRPHFHIKVCRGERQSPPAVSANAPPQSSHVNGTTSRLAIPPSPI